MKRTKLARGKPLPRGSSRLKRSTRIRAIGARGLADRAELDAVRPLVLKRAKGKCERCGRPCAKPDLHHRLMRSQGGKHTAGNLAALCGGPDGCHDAVHAHAPDWRDWIVTRRGAA